MFQETDFYNETRTGVQGSSAAHMTPRRVKRRSYTRNSTRSAGKVSSNKQQNNRRSTRSLGRTTGSRALNPVTRLMERDDRARNPIIDSSTSNDGTERYGVLAGPAQTHQNIGLINHAFESSRPNSLYSALPGGSSVLSNQQSRWDLPLLKLILDVYKIDVCKNVSAQAIQWNLWSQTKPNQTNHAT
jgi:hypothetical protein